MLDIFNLPAITNLLNRMTDNNAAQRLNLTDIVQVLEKILNSPESSS
ncbi:MAG: hypothetical protein M3525_13335 [Acidobacteriota bacterium]|nr:hypothetical protein [Acidobacteriota bacterium]